MAKSKKEEPIEEDDGLSELPEENVENNDELVPEEPDTSPKEEEESPFVDTPSKHYVVDFSVNMVKSELEEAIAFLRKSVKTTNILPITGDFLIVFNKEFNTCVITTTNLDTLARYTIKKVEVPFDFSLCINMDEFSKVIKACINPSIILSIEKHTLKFLDGFDEFVLDLTDEPSHFPSPKALSSETAIGLSFEKKTFLAYLKEVVNYADDTKDSLRPAMTGVSISCDINGTDIAATNAHILKHVHFDSPSSPENISVIIPREFTSALLLLSNIGEKEDDQIVLVIDKEGRSAEVTVGDGKYHVSGRIIDEKYPNYKAVIPTTGFNTIKFELKTLLRDINRLTAINTESMYVVFNFADDQVVLKTHSNTSIKGAKIKMDVDVAKDFKVERIGFGIPLMQVVLKALTEGDVYFHIVADNRACLITPEETIGDNVSLIMPVMVGH